MHFVCHSLTMDYRIKFGRGMNLQKMLALLEEEEDNDTFDTAHDIQVSLQPPEDGNMTDEDSGDETGAVLDNLPGSQLRAPAFLQINGKDYNLGSSDDESSQPHPQPIPESSDDESSPPRPKQTKKCKEVKKKPEKSKWTANADIKSNDEQWLFKEGPKNELSPIDLFCLFFDEELVEHLVIYTNQYAAKKNKVGDISNDEMKCFIGILLLSGYVTLPRRKLYWQSQKDTYNAMVSESLSRDRFDFIMSNLHVCDNDALDTRDKFSKVRPLFQILNAKFQEHAPFEECHSIDETMVPYYGRHSCKQFIRGKPIRWGFKLWTAATPKGYIIWSEPYQGKGTNHSKYDAFGVGAGVVLTYSDVLRKVMGDFSFQLFFDNFFTSVKLINELRNRGFFATGTIRDNRLEQCPVKKKHLLKKEERGAMSYAADKVNNLVICSWNDNNIVSLASNATGVNPTRLVWRYSQKQKKKIQIPQPNLAARYNQCMGGVDRSDENIGLYRISIRGKKWYSCLIQYLIDAAEQNAWQLHRDNNGTLDHLAFRRSVVTSLLAARKKSGFGRHRAPRITAERYDGIEHYVIVQKNQTRCALCHMKTTTRCNKCDKGLHTKCFLPYHVK